MVKFAPRLLCRCQQTGPQPPSTKPEVIEFINICCNNVTPANVGWYSDRDDPWLGQCLRRAAYTEADGSYHPDDIGVVSACNVNENGDVHVTVRSSVK